MNSYEIEILDLVDYANMNEIQAALYAAGISDAGDPEVGVYLRDGKPESIFVDPSEVVAAVKVINGLGYTTDEDEMPDTAVWEIIETWRGGGERRGYYDAAFNLVHGERVNSVAVDEAKAGFRGHKTVAPYSDLFVYPVNYVPSEINVGDSVTVNSPSRYLAPGVEMINIPAVIVGIDSDGRYLLECDSAVWPEWGTESLPFQRAEINPADAN